MHRRQYRRQLLQHRNGRRLIAYENAPTSSSKNLPAQDHLLAIKIEPILAKDSSHRLGLAGVLQLENGAHYSFVSSVTNHIGRRFFSQQQRERVNKNGFPGARFAGQEI